MFNNRGMKRSLAPLKNFFPLPLIRGEGLDAIDTMLQTPPQSPEYLRLVLIKPVLKHKRRFFGS